MDVRIFDILVKLNVKRLPSLERFFNLSQFQTYLGLDAENQGENQGSNVAEDCVPGKDKDKRCEEN